MSHKTRWGRPRKGAAQGHQADAASAASSAEGGSQRHVTAAPLPHPADIESGSGSQAANGTPQQQPQQQQQQQSPGAQASVERSEDMGRRSSLMAPESVYAAHHWKSLLRTQSSRDHS